MAFKEICLFSTLLVIAIINYNVVETEALIPIDQLTNQYLNIQRDLYSLQQSEFNLMNDSQKLYDILKEYSNGRLDIAAVQAAQAELLRTRLDWYKKAFEYQNDITNFERVNDYPYGPDSYLNGVVPPPVAPLNPLNPLNPVNPLNPNPAGDTDVYIVT